MKWSCGDCARVHGQEDAAAAAERERQKLIAETLRGLVGRAMRALYQRAVALVPQAGCTAWLKCKC